MAPRTPRLASAPERDYLRPMDQPDLTPPPEPTQTAEERAARIAWEDRATEEAEREGTIPAEEVGSEAWIPTIRCATCSAGSVPLSHRAASDRRSAAAKPAPRRRSPL